MHNPTFSDSSTVPHPLATRHLKCLHFLFSLNLIPSPVWASFDFSYYLQSFQSAAFPMRIRIISLPVKISMLWPGLMPFLAKLSFSGRLLAKCGIPSVCTSHSLRSLVKSLLQSFKCNRWILEYILSVRRFSLWMFSWLIRVPYSPFRSLVSGGQATSPLTSDVNSQRSLSFSVSVWMCPALREQRADVKTTRNTQSPFCFA